MRLRLLLIALVALAAPSVVAQADPLSLNLGTGPNSRNATPVRTLFQQTQDAINAAATLGSQNQAAINSTLLLAQQNQGAITSLQGLIGAPGGIATLGPDGKILPGQLTPAIPSYTAAPSISVAPTGNTIGTLSTLSVQGTTGSTSTREFVANFGITSNKGSTQDDNSGNGDKVAVYAGAVQQVGSGNAWALNTLTERQSGVTKSTLGYELDINNNDQHLGETLGYAGSAARPFLYGMEITGAGAYRSTAAVSISGPGDHFLWNRGIVFNNNSTKQASVQDNTVADISYDIRGGHIYGIDIANSGIVQAPIRLPKGSSIVAGVADSGGARQDGSNVQVVGTDSAGNVQLAYDGSTLAVLGSSMIPRTTSSIDLGSTATRFRTLYLNNLLLTPYAPPSSSAACASGTISADASYIYVCTATDTWKRSALTAY